MAKPSGGVEQANAVMLARATPLNPGVGRLLFFVDGRFFIPLST
ncbi:MAG: hypothetical protein R2932_26090 [Caldilineaceae bacterium]